MPIIEVAANFAHGYVSDVSRDQLPSTAASRMKDWIPSLDARLRRRGAWTYTSPDLSSLAGITSLAAAGWMPYGTDEHLVVISGNGAVFLDRDFDGVHASLVSATGSVNSGMTFPPFWHSDLQGMVLLGPTPILHDTPYKYYWNGAAYATAVLGGTPPGGTVGCSWGDYLLLANGSISGTIYSRRIWVSGVGLPESWTPGTNFWDSVIPTIIGLVPVRSGILVFGYENISLISGDTPPAGGNWSETIIFRDYGCWDARSIAKYGDTTIFANSTGVYSTDGITLKDITAASGVKLRWQELVQNFDLAQGWKVSAGIFRGKYIIRVHDNSGNLVTCHVFDLASDVAYEFTNILSSGMFVHRPLAQGVMDGGIAVSGQEMLFVVSSPGTFVQGLHTAWTAPDAPTDANGTDILPQLETPFYKPGGPGKKVFRSMRATYDVRSSGGSAPALTVDYCTTPGGAYTNAGSLPTTTDEDRQRVDVRQRGRGIGLRLTQSAKSSHTTLSELELDVRALEAMR